MNGEEFHEIKLEDQDKLIEIDIDGPKLSYDKEIHLRFFNASPMRVNLQSYVKDGNQVKLQSKPVESNESFETMTYVSHPWNAFV